MKLHQEIRNACRKIELQVAKLSPLTEQLAGDAVREVIRSLGLEIGFESCARLAQDADDFLTRLTTDSEEKDSLAKYFCRKTEDGSFPGLMTGRTVDQKKRGIRPFFECGSTIAYVIGEFAGQLDALQKRTASATAQPDIVLSNNMFCGTALANLVAEVVTVSGYLSTKYGGHLPCPDKEFPDIPGTEIIRSRFEAKFYNRLCEDIGTCDQIFATCSNFSFVAGPLVGSRANAVAKYAIGTGRQDECLYATCFSFGKLLPITEPPPGISNDVTKREDMDRCRVVFPHRRMESYPELGIRKGWHRNWPRLEKTTEFEDFRTQTTKYFGAGTLRNSSLKTWGDVATNAYIVIALPAEFGDAIKSWLVESELPKAAAIMDLMKQPLSFELQNHTKSHIAEILIKR